MIRVGPFPKAAGMAAACILCLLVAGRGQVKIGISAGGTASNFNNQTSSGGGQTSSGGGGDNSVKAGFNGAIRVEVPVTAIGKTCSFRMAPELFVIQNGANGQYTSSTGDSTGKVNLNYVGLSIPAKLDIRFGDSSGGMYLMASGFFDRVVSSNVTSESNQQSSLYFASGSDRYDYGFRFSAAVLYPKKGNGPMLALEVGYNMGLNNINFYTVGTPGSKTGGYQVKNNGFTVSVVTAW